MRTAEEWAIDLGVEFVEDIRAIQRDAAEDMRKRAANEVQEAIKLGCAWESLKDVRRLSLPGDDK